MADHPHPKRKSVILTIWVQGENVWRGYVESASGSRHYFASLEQLNALLSRFGWQDGAQRTGLDSPQFNDKKEET